MSAVCCGGANGCGRGSYYQKIPESRQRRAASLLLRRASAVVARRAVEKMVGFYVGRRRWAERRVAWAAGLWGKVRKSLGSVRIATAAAQPVLASYDEVSYAQNFDDGRWREEEDEYWRCGSFACRFGQSGRYGGKSFLDG